MEELGVDDDDNVGSIVDRLWLVVEEKLIVGWRKPGGV